jgi:hypothetical protein
LNAPTGDADLVAGFGQLVGRVAALEMAVRSLLAGSASQADPSSVDEEPAGQTSPAAPSPEVATDALSASPLPAPILRAWEGASLALRLKFVRELLPAENPCQMVLKEAQGMQELCRNGRELETWLTGYPSLFADAVERLETCVPCGDGPAPELARALLDEARQLLLTEVAALEIDWILPTVGADIGADHEVVGEEEAAVPAGRIARVKRRGFHRQGELKLPAQVVRSKGQREAPQMVQVAPQTAPPATVEDRPMTPARSLPVTVSRQPITANQPPATSHQPPALDPWPDWLRAFQQRSVGCTVPVIAQLFAALRGVADAAARHAAGTLAEEALTVRLEPLLPLLGARHVPSLLGLTGEWGDLAAEARDDLMVWLRAGLEIEPLVPAVGEPCDPATMQSVGARRTSHPHEDGAVAKVERIGLRRGDRTLFRAQVLCYELGAGYE